MPPNDGWSYREQVGPAAAATLARAWREHLVKETYRAWCEGAASADTLAIDAPIGPVPHPRLGTVQAASSRGRPSHSAAVVERVTASALAR